MLFRVDTKSKATGEERSITLKLSNAKDHLVEVILDAFTKELGPIYWRVVKLED